MEEKKKMPERQIKVKIKDNEYLCEFPTTGGLMEIEVLKTQLARGQYSEISNAGTVNSGYSRLLIDMIATINVLIPKLRKDMNVASISELHPIDSKTILQVYLKTILPWLNEWFIILNSDEEEIAKDAI